MLQLDVRGNLGGIGNLWSHTRLRRWAAYLRLYSLMIDKLQKAQDKSNDAAGRSGTTSAGI